MGWALAAASAAALVDWIAVLRGWASVEAFAKPLVMVMLALAIVLELDGLTAWLALTAVVAALVGDVLLLPSVDAFVSGLAAFLIAHVFYGTAFLSAGVEPGWVILGAVLGLAGIVLAGRAIVAGATRRDDQLGRAVIGYIMALTTMLALAFGVSPVVAAGAIIFVLSDAVLGWNRFVDPLPRGRLLTHVPYHIGQITLIAGLL